MIRRRKWLARGKPPRRRSLRRAGLSAAESLELRLLHKRAVMLRYRAREQETASGKMGWRGSCLRCLKDRWLQCSHIEPVGKNPHMRYDADNAIPLCGPCHIFWWHRAPREAERWITAKLGEKKREELAIRADCTKGTRFDFFAMKLYLIDQIRKLGHAT